MNDHSSQRGLLFGDILLYFPGDIRDEVEKSPIFWCLGAAVFWCEAGTTF